MNFLATFFNHALHFKHNELGHNATGNAIVGVINGAVVPAISSAASEATGGLVNITATPATGTTLAEEQQSEALAAVLQDLLAAPSLMKALLATHQQAVAAGVTPVTRAVATPVQTSPGEDTLPAAPPTVSAVPAEF